jgi:hypothetical protein
VKKDIEAYQAGLQEVLQIQPKWYRYNELAPTNSQERFVGVIAQEIKDVAPYMVEKKPLPGLSAKQARKFEKNEKGVPMHYVYDGSAMQYMLVNATQEQQQQIKTLRQANRQLRQDIQQLRQTVQQLQKHVRAE